MHNPIVPIMQTSLYTQFQQQALQTPLASCLHGTHYSFNYLQALQTIDIIADNLQHSGVRAGDCIGIFADKDVPAVLTFIALSRLGAAIVTLDKAFPEEMLAYVYKDAQITRIITDAPMPVSAPPASYMKDLMSANALVDRKEIPVFTTASWIVYSSGTSGCPKGIEISERALLHSIHSRYQFADYEPSDKTACSIYFYWEVFRPLLRGAQVFTLEDSLILDLGRYAHFIEANAISETLWTPSFAEMLLAHLEPVDLQRLSGLKRVWLNGEVVTRHLTKLLLERLPKTECYNLYSISETVDVSARKLSETGISADGFASIGKALPGVEILILNENLEACTPMEQGELYISGEALAEGYLNQPEQEKASFKCMEYQGKTFRAFRTKDIAYQNEDEEIFILGRNDHIVKLRGYNVSLLAIEDTLKQVLAIHSGFVKIEGDSAVNQQLVAYLRPVEAQSFAENYALNADSGHSAALHALLANHLPHYAIPSRFYCIDEVHLSQYSSKTIRHVDTTKALHRNPLAALWQEVLGIPKEMINADSDFFAFGATSLQAVQFVQLFNKRFDKPIDINVIYQHSRFSELENWVAGIGYVSMPVHSMVLQDLSIEDIVPSNSPLPVKHNSLRTADTVLITGATGFLGAHWLASCLIHTKARFYCLIRAENALQGERRLQEAFQQYRLDTGLLRSRVIVISGDLSEKQMGLSECQWEELGGKVDIILHAAANVNLMHTYEKLRSVAVYGTKNCLALAISQRLKPFFLISSDAVFSAKTRMYRQSFLLDDSITELGYGYAQSKWAQEKLLQLVAKTYRLPFYLLRLGNLSPSLDTGIANPQDGNGMFIKMVKKHQRIPANLRLEFTPVDRVVSLLTECCLQPFGNVILSLDEINVLDADMLQKLMPEWALQQTDATVWNDLILTVNPELYGLLQKEGLFTQRADMSLPIKTENMPLLKLDKRAIKQSILMMSQSIQSDTTEAIS